jgi:hypothetical protein
LLQATTFELDLLSLRQFPSLSFFRPQTLLFEMAEQNPIKVLVLGATGYV